MYNECSNIPSINEPVIQITPTHLCGLGTIIFIFLRWMAGSWSYRLQVADRNQTEISAF